MAKGRGSARSGVAAALVTLLCLLVHSENASAATYTIGWMFNVVSWPEGKSFSAGDVLVFNYDPTSHNVVAVDSGGYTGCTASSGAQVYQTGNDQITLTKGMNYFICSFAGHCENGMKIAVNAV
ncbi:basic blue-like protein [Cinnamomum micranthum f. kanehirae]|uniref:Plantacyanin n=1 Tax=Cinnamomum micranthum f. kanehirae TaxID=337451 RepID=A0A3S3Q0P6_9MAGN|nr:basic blue-like protein [Cinnamomum micranthum f. kanehirae]